MLKQFFHYFFIYGFLGTMGLNSSFVYSEVNSFSPSHLSHPQFSPHSHQNDLHYDHSEEREEIAYRDSYDSQNRRGNWDFKESWRHNKDVFFSGWPQTQAYQEQFRYQATPGIGDPDDVYYPADNNYNYNYNQNDPNFYYNRDYFPYPNPNRSYRSRYLPR